MTFGNSFATERLISTLRLKLLRRSRLQGEAPSQLEYPPPPEGGVINYVSRNRRSGSDTEHTAGDATYPTARSGSATAHDGPAAADTYTPT